jgi:sec1 family domain-containing protein 1
VPDKNAPQDAATTYSIDFTGDHILRENAFLGFHDAGPNVDKQLKSWTAEKEKLNQTQSSADAMASALSSAMDALPQMTERKRKIDMHIQIASKILQEINRRELNKLQDWEDEIMTSGEGVGQ